MSDAESPTLLPPSPGCSFIHQRRQGQYVPRPPVWEVNSPNVTHENGTNGGAYNHVPREKFTNFDGVLPLPGSDQHDPVQLMANIFNEKPLVVNIMSSPDDEYATGGMSSASTAASGGYTRFHDNSIPDGPSPEDVNSYLVGQLARPPLKDPQTDIHPAGEPYSAEKAENEGSSGHPSPVLDDDEQALIPPPAGYAKPLSEQGNVESRILVPEQTFRLRVCRDVAGVLETAFVEMKVMETTVNPHSFSIIPNKRVEGGNGSAVGQTSVKANNKTTKRKGVIGAISSSLGKGVKRGKLHFRKPLNPTSGNSSSTSLGTAELEDRRQAAVQDISRTFPPKHPEAITSESPYTRARSWFAKRGLGTDAELPGSRAARRPGNILGPSRPGSPIGSPTEEEAEPVRPGNLRSSPANGAALGNPNGNDLIGQSFTTEEEHSNRGLVPPPSPGLAACQDGNPNQECLPASDATAGRPNDAGKENEEISRLLAPLKG